jgi:hypothetical protein
MQREATFSAEALFAFVPCVAPELASAQQGPLRPEAGAVPNAETARGAFTGSSVARLMLEYPPRQRAASGARANQGASKHEHPEGQECGEPEGP